MEHVRDLRDILVDRVLGGTTDQMEENFIDGYARFIEPGVLQAGEDVVHAGSVVVACGSRPAIPPEWAELVEEGGRIRVTGAEHSVCVDRVLACTGRQSNLDWLAIDQAGIVLDEHGLPVFDPHTMRCGDSRVFIAGDVTGDRQVLHEATDEGRIAGYNAARADSTAFARKTPFAVTFTDPNICTVGTPFSELDPATTAVGEMRLGPVGRALVMGANRGIVHLYADKASGLLLGAALVAPRGENLAHLLAWCLGKGMTVLEMLRQPFYHPTMEEALQGALRDLLAKVETELELADAPPDIAPLASQ
jgi:dihydrolipoamide dehydrogenase